MKIGLILDIYNLSILFVEDLRLIRMLPSIKVSYTNETLVNSYMQADSISNSKLNIINAARLLLKKNYSLNIEQKANFTKFLNKILKINIERY